MRSFLIGGPVLVCQEFLAYGFYRLSFYVRKKLESCRYLLSKKTLSQSLSFSFTREHSASVYAKCSSCIVHARAPRPRPRGCRVGSAAAVAERLRGAGHVVDPRLGDEREQGGAGLGLRLGLEGLDELGLDGAERGGVPLAR